jgi:hypothetical protein
MKSKFKDALLTCSDEAILIIKENPNIDFSDLLINATINIFDYCSDCDCDHEEFLFSLIKNCLQREYIESFILDNLLNNKHTLASFSLFNLAKLMFIDGNKQAKDIIYKRYSKNLLPDFPFIDTYVPIELDGFDGLKFTSEVKGHFFIENNYFWEDNKIIDILEKLYPNNNFLFELNQISETNKFIKEFLLKSIKKENLLDKKSISLNW